MKFLRFLCFIIVIAVSAFVVYYFMEMSKTYVKKETDNSTSVVQNNNENNTSNNSTATSKSKAKNEELIKRAREKVKLEDVLVMSGDKEDTTVSLITIRKNNIDNTIEQNLISQNVKMFKDVKVVLDIYGKRENRIYTENYVLANIQVAGTMINIIPQDETHDTIAFHFAENGKLEAYTRYFADMEVTTTVYFDENEIPFEQYFDTKDKSKIVEENFEKIYERAKTAYSRYFNLEEEN